MAKEPQSNPSQRKRVSFKLDAPGVEEVILVGDFNNWSADKHFMKKDNYGRWSKSVVLAPGRYEYKYLVDGQWHNDPQNDHLVANCFASFNNVLTVQLGEVCP